MEMLRGSKVGLAVEARSRAWRSVKKLASGCMRRRRKLVGAVSRRVVLWGSSQHQLKKKVYGGITNANKSKRNDLSYDIFGYTNNFDDGKWKQEEDEFYSRRSFSFRFVNQATAPSTTLNLIDS